MSAAKTPQGTPQGNAQANGGKTWQRTLVTAALPYANGPIHLGHLAGVYLPADIYCRYLRLLGRDVLYICGSDEHGVPILLRARSEGVEAQEIVDRYHKGIEESFARFGMSFDYYGRTTSDTHRETSSEFFRVMAEKGSFVSKTESQLFDPEASIFLADRFVRGTCPSCGFDDAYGDQCESCGSSLSPTELKNPRSAITNAEPILKETTHWYLPLAKAQPWLEEWIASHEEWRPTVLGQIRSWFAAGLADRAVTRDLPWGVPIPEDVAAKAGIDAAGKVLYVWFDAPIGYISATREWAQMSGKPDAWKAYWQDDACRLIHFIGKDNIVFHCLIFPWMLKSHGGYVLPDNVPANEFLNIEGKKISTSRGWAIWLSDYLEDFPPDYLRYGLSTILPETKDADFSWKDFQARVNNELADTLGNFVNRTVTFCDRYFDGLVPALDGPNEKDTEALAALAGFPAKVAAHIEAFRFRDGVACAMSLGRLGNKYFNDAEPWATRKKDMRACGNTIHVSLQLCAALSILFEPVLPFSCAKIRDMLRLEGLRSSGPDVAAGGEGELGWEDAARPLLEAGHKLGTPEILFTKILDKQVEEQILKLNAGKLESVAGCTSGAAYAPLKDYIEFDDFAKLDLRIGTVLEAEKVKKSKRLLRTLVDLGFEQRQILAGVAEFIAPEDLIGKKVVVVANLEPRKMMGLESQGMLLMAEDREGKLVPIVGESEAGAVLR